MPCEWPRTPPLRHLPLVATLAVLCLAGCHSAGAPTGPGADVPVSGTLQAIIDEWARQPGHEGVSASVVFPNGSQWTGVAGRSGNAPLKPNDLISIGSITKTMTAAVILQLVDEGRLTLDDPLSRWLPSRPFVTPAITIRQLLNHTNGLDNYTRSAALGQAIDQNPSHVFTSDELLTFIGPPHFAPGAGTEYTNTAFVLLGEVAEHVTGESIVSLWQTRLWDRFGVSEVFLPLVQSAPGPVALAATSFGVVSPLDYPALASVGGTAFGLMATARAIATWGHALFAGAVLSGSMQQQMRAMVPAAGNIPGESGAGLGIRGYTYLGHSQIGHSGGSSFGSALLLHDPSTSVTVAVLVNQSQGAGHFDLAPALLGAAHGQ